MPIYMDVHPNMGDVTPEDVADAHRREIAVQDQFGVQVLSYWFSDEEGKAFCMASAPDADAMIASHKASHGLTPHNVIEVDPPTMAKFLGNTTADPNDRVVVDGEPDTGLRAIMFTDIEGSTDVSTTFGDRAAVDLVRRHDTVVRDALDVFSGREIKHTGDGLLACFVSVTKAVDASIAIQQACASDTSTEPNLALKIGLSAGEPVEESRDLYGAAVNLAARICSHAQGDQTLVAGTIRDLSIGKNRSFVGQGAIDLKGFPDPVPLFEVDWADTLS